MHRAAIRALRATHRSTARGLSHGRSAGRNQRCLSQSSPSSQPQSSPTSPYSAQEIHSELPQPPLQSSMYFRRVSVALVSGLVGYGAWYSYNGTSADHGQPLSRGFTTTSTIDHSAEPTRHVLVIGADELHKATVVGDGPISKMTNHDGRRVLEIINPEQATEVLRKSEESYLVNRGQGVVRYDLVQLPSNNPIEDDHDEKIVEVPSRMEGASNAESSDWMFWGVFDGHAGWTTSAKLRQTLISVVANQLNETYKAAPGMSPAAEAIDKAIKAGFTKLDDEIVHQSVEKVLKSGSKTLAAELLQPALSGSCALLSFYDSRSKLLRVACTGDSRAVLGRRSESGKWTATALSVDQTGSNPDEVARMRKRHPGEDEVIKHGRVLGGLEPTRAFGDATYKWSRDISTRLRNAFFGRTPSPRLKTPPYVTAEPVVTTTKIEPENGDFLVMASDGLWEMLTNEEVVGLVGKWIETHGISGSGSGSSGPSNMESVWAKIFGSSKQAQLPIEQGGDNAADGQKTPIRVQQWGLSPDASGRFVVKDENVATHLVRNALGGKNEEQVCSLLTLPAPFSRRYRDDLTVQVIFFGNSIKTGNGEVVPNVEAMAPLSQPAKAKL
ncbi:phosphatase [Sodiomyces alkalinus F11]|uniref:Phosphatase n=1 Tax=Sodiomyces alkalinus (strain CBS 110278 / VKM F-3762 / F11) TaxID=1314773 RepID=A0A3N2Q9T4_SODAK|nr:phosphatase [Sodiomyces alkalinus F11]ROT43523.1 phosphatase [Sodiomyces alkalinus F11]